MLKRARNFDAQDISGDKTKEFSPTYSRSYRNGLKVGGSINLSKDDILFLVASQKDLSRFKSPERLKTSSPLSSSDANLTGYLGRELNRKKPKAEGSTSKSKRPKIDDSRNGVSERLIVIGNSERKSKASSHHGKKTPDNKAISRVNSALSNTPATFRRRKDADLTVNIKNVVSATDIYGNKVHRLYYPGETSPRERSPLPKSYQDLLSGSQTAKSMSRGAGIGMSIGQFKPIDLSSFTLAGIHTPGNDTFKQSQSGLTTRSKVSLLEQKVSRLLQQVKDSQILQQEVDTNSKYLMLDSVKPSLRIKKTGRELPLVLSSPKSRPLRIHRSFLDLNSKTSMKEMRFCLALASLQTLDSQIDFTFLRYYSNKPTLQDSKPISSSSPERRQTPNIAEPKPLSTTLNILREVETCRPKPCRKMAFACEYSHSWQTNPNCTTRPGLGSSLHMLRLGHLRQKRNAKNTPRTQRLNLEVPDRPSPHSHQRPCFQESNQKASLASLRNCSTSLNESWEGYKTQDEDCRLIIETGEYEHAPLEAKLDLLSQVNILKSKLLENICKQSGGFAIESSKFKNQTYGSASELNVASIHIETPQQDSPRDSLKPGEGSYMPAMIDPDLQTPTFASALDASYK